MDIIYNEAIAQTQFYQNLSIFAEKKDKKNFLTCLMEKTGCDFNTAKQVCDYFIDNIPLPTNLSPAEIARNEAEARELLNKPKCPTCQSTNLKKISVTSKALNTAMWGIFGTKRHKTFHCNHCGYEW